MKILLLLALSFSALADDFKVVEDKLMSAIKSDIRSEKEGERDRNRRPVSTLSLIHI